MTFEPTLGADAQGRLFYSMTPPPGAAIGFGTGVWRSDDGGLTWVDVTPKIADRRMPPETNDPYVYVDPGTGRVFQFAMAPVLVCSILSWSDDQGQSWTTNPRGCGNPGVWDHQTMVAAKPRISSSPLYPNVLVQCVNQVTHAWCARSLDGGLTWTPGSVAYANEYLHNFVIGDGCPGSSVHGHLKAAPDGTVYLPSALCGHEAIVAVSKDDGLTWKRVRVSDVVPATTDPAVAVDDAGNAYYAFTDRVGRLMLSVSTDGGDTWSEAVEAAPAGMTTNMPAIAAGAAGRIVLAYPGTMDLPQGFDTPQYDASPQNSTFLRTVRWSAYLTVSTNAHTGAPTFQTVAGNDLADPIVRGQCGPGRCPGLVDFIDVTIAPDGRPHAAFVDACITRCVTHGSLGNIGTGAVLVSLTSGPSLR